MEQAYHAYVRLPVVYLLSICYLFRKITFLQRMAKRQDYIVDRNKSKRLS